MCYDGQGTGDREPSPVSFWSLIMGTKYYIIVRIDGDYAWLKRTDTEKAEEPVFIARALLPEGAGEGTKLKSEFLQYEIVE